MKGLSDPNSEELDDRADLVPLIDCVFLVLLFYVVVSTFSEDTLFKVELPKAQQTTVRAAEETVTIAVDKTGQYAIGQDLVADADLWTRLEERHKTKPIRTLIIRGDKGCPYEKIVTALDIAQALNISEFSLIVSQE